MHKVAYKNFNVLAVFLLLGAVNVSGQKKDNSPGNKGQYKNIEVVKFDVKEGIQFPPDYMNGMMDETVKELQGLKKFQQVLREGETQTDAAAPTIRLIGTVTQYNPGNRTKRYLFPGAGKTKIVAHVKFIDKATGNVLFEKDVDGKVVIGIFGGDSKGSLHGVGKEISEVAKKQFF